MAELTPSVQSHNASSVNGTATSIETGAENPVNSTNHKSSLSTIHPHAVSSQIRTNTGAEHQAHWSEKFRQGLGVVVHAIGHLLQGMTGVTGFREAYARARGNYDPFDVEINDWDLIGISLTAPVTVCGILLGAMTGGIVRGGHNLSDFYKRGGLHVLRNDADYQRARDELLSEIMDQHGAQDLREYDQSHSTDYRGEIEQLVRWDVNKRCDRRVLTKLDVRRCVEKTVAWFGDLKTFPQRLANKELSREAVNLLNRVDQESKQTLVQNGYIRTANGYQYLQ